MRLCMLLYKLPSLGRVVFVVACANSNNIYMYPYGKVLPFETINNQPDKV